MSGHNKFSKIKHKKGAEDAKKSKLYSVMVKQITSESRKAKGDKNSTGLRAVIEKARSVNMPSENIERAVAKGAGISAGSMEEILCEAYGPGGVALIIEGITDSKNRTINEIKFILSENNASLGSQGSVVWAFKKNEDSWVPTVTIPLLTEDLEKLGALIEDLEAQEDVEGVYTNRE